MREFHDYFNTRGKIKIHIYQDIYLKVHLREKLCHVQIHLGLSLPKESIIDKLKILLTKKKCKGLVCQNCKTCSYNFENLDKVILFMEQYMEKGFLKKKTLSNNITVFKIFSLYYSLSIFTPLELSYCVGVLMGLCGDYLILCAL